MTPTFRWVFLLALVGRAASVPRPLVVDACALLCNPGAETESERARDPELFPRYPKVNCRLQSESDEHQAWVLASHCLKLCGVELSIPSEVNCFAMRSSLQANLGCYCDALTPLSPNTMRLHESWRLNFLVKEIAADILEVILSSPLDTIILCELHEELFKNNNLEKGKLVDKCTKTDNPENTTTTTTAAPITTEAPERAKRSVDEEYSSWDHSHSMDDIHEMLMDEPMIETEMEPMMEDIDVTDVPMDDVHEMMHDSALRRKLFPSKKEEEEEKIPENPLFKEFVNDWKRVCKILCKYERGDQFCHCQNPELDR
ncbi:hypothetical protein P5V15_006154 [Pogonomyrmex californicus]